MRGTRSLDTDVEMEGDSDLELTELTADKIIVASTSRFPSCEPPSSDLETETDNSSDCESFDFEDQVLVGEAPLPIGNNFSAVSDSAEPAFSDFAARDTEATSSDSEKEWVAPASTSCARELIGITNCRKRWEAWLPKTDNKAWRDFITSPSQGQSAAIVRGWTEKNRKTYVFLFFLELERKLLHYADIGRVLSPSLSRDEVAHSINWLKKNYFITVKSVDNCLNEVRLRKLDKKVVSKFKVPDLLSEKVNELVNPTAPAVFGPSALPEAVSESNAFSPQQEEYEPLHADVQKEQVEAEGVEMEEASDLELTETAHENSTASEFPRLEPSSKSVAIEVAASEPETPLSRTSCARKPAAAKCLVDNAGELADCKARWVYWCSTPEGKLWSTFINTVEAWEGKGWGSGAQVKKRMRNRKKMYAFSYFLALERTSLNYEEMKQVLFEGKGHAPAEYALGWLRDRGLLCMIRLGNRYRRRRLDLCKLDEGLAWKLRIPDLLIQVVNNNLKNSGNTVATEKRRTRSYDVSVGKENNPLVGRKVRPFRSIRSTFSPNSEGGEQSINEAASKDIPDSLKEAVNRLVDSKSKITTGKRKARSQDFSEKENCPLMERKAKVPKMVFSTTLFAPKFTEGEPENTSKGVNFSFQNL